MNVLSFILAIIAAVIFALTYRGHPHASIGGGLCVVTIAWIVQLTWTTTQITF